MILILRVYCRKRYVRAEREFIEAKQLLFGKRERKELLTEHLCTIIEQNEMRKAHRLTDLMVQLSQQDQVTNNAFTEVNLLSANRRKLIHFHLREDGDQYRDRRHFADHRHAVNLEEHNLHNDCLI